MNIIRQKTIKSLNTKKSYYEKKIQPINDIMKLLHEKSTNKKLNELKQKTINHFNIKKANYEKKIIEIEDTIKLLIEKSVDKKSNKQKVGFDKPGDAKKEISKFIK